MKLIEHVGQTGHPICIVVNEHFKPRWQLMDEDSGGNEASSLPPRSLPTSRL